MAIYSKFIFPRLMHRGMSVKSFTPYRKKILSHARGKVLGLEFGTGLNLPFYPASVTAMHAVDVNEGMRFLAAKNIALSPIEVHLQVLDARQLPFADEYFDTVVSTWTLCSIPNVSQALREAYRVLSTEGRFLFVEHGLSHEPAVQKWQHRLTPIQK